MPFPTSITESGVRSVIQRMFRAIERSEDTRILFEEPTACLFREDGHWFELGLQKNCFLSSEGATEAPEPIYEIILRWRTDGMVGDSDDPFVVAMNRMLGTGVPCITLDAITADLRSVRTHGDFARECTAQLQRFMTYRLCPCQQNIVAEEEEVVCFTCHIGLEAKDLSRHMCGVCHDTCNARIEQTLCCQQWIHDMCAKKCGTKCPFCRAMRMVFRSTAPTSTASFTTRPLTVEDLED